MTHHIEALPVLVLSPHARCNCRCLMCDIWKNTEDEQLSVEQLESHLSDIQRLQVKWVVFSGGEPLMHTDLFRLSAMLRSRSIRVTVLSTGLLLERYASHIASEIDDLIISLDGPPPVHDRIRRVPGATARLQIGMGALHQLNPKFPIAARCTVQKANHDRINETAAFAHQSGFRSISFLAADLTSEAFNRKQPWDVNRQSQVALNAQELDRLTAEFSQLSENWKGSGFIMEGPEKLARIVEHFRSHLGFSEPEAPQCNAPWVSVVVEADGTVRPCFFHPPIGSLRTHTLLQVLNGFEAQAFRASLDVPNNPVCKRCVCSLHLV
jgi:Fe-coproporphyrin III synthase